MEKELEQFQQEVQRLRMGRRGGSGPFPEALRAFAVRYLAYAQEKGETVREVTKRLGVSEPTLQAWRRGQTPGSKARRAGERSVPLVPVVVQPRKAEAPVQSPASLTVVTPQGWRVEGLGVESAADLLRRLAC